MSMEGQFCIGVDKVWIVLDIKGDAKSFLQQILIAVFRGYNCILYWLIKLITEFLAVQKAI